MKISARPVSMPQTLSIPSLDSKQFKGAIFCHLERLTSSQIQRILGKLVSLVQALIVIASRVLEWQMAFAIMVGQLESAVLTLIVIPASYVVSCHGKERDRGNGIVV